MDFLLDTHLAYWYIMGDQKIPKMAKELIGDRSNHIYVSLISAWEIGLKHAKKPTSLPMDAEAFIQGCNEAGFIILPIIESQLLESMNITSKEGLDHHDPFDRFLLGVANAMNMRFLTHDNKIACYDNPYVLFL